MSPHPTPHLPARALLLGALLLGVLPAACARPSSGASPGRNEEAAAGGARKRELPRVRVAEVERREMVHVLETTSVLESENEIDVLPRVAGIALEVLAEEGDRVGEGDVLARLDDRDQVLAVKDAEVALQEAENTVEQARLSIEQATANVKSANLAAEQAERDQQRNQRLFEGETVSALSRKALEDGLLARDNAIAERERAEISLRSRQLEASASETALARARVNLDRARLNLSYTDISAPFDGIIAERNVRVGDTVNMGEKVFVLTDTNNLRTVFLRPQEELELFTKSANDTGSLTFTATAEAYPDRVFHGKVLRVSPTIQPASGQFRVTARIETPPDNDSTPLLPGMLMRMQIVTERHPDALVVPKRALRREGETRFVLVVEEQGEPGAGDTTVRKVVVQESFSDDDHVEVIPDELGAIDVGNAVVEVGSRDLEDGDLVQVENVVDELDETLAVLPAAGESESEAEALAADDGAGSDAE